MAIYITGDTHGDFTRFRTSIFYEQKNLNKDDFVIICGDFGLWDDSPQERHWLEWLDQKPFTTLFVSGNHENYDRLAQYPVEQWHGGKVQRIRPSILHLMRGQVFELFGQSFFTMGGASSHDITDGILEPEDPSFKQKLKQMKKRNALFRVNHQSWWKEELPSAEEYQEAKNTLKSRGWSVDYIISHCAPTSIQHRLGGDAYLPDELTEFLEEIRRRCQFRYWFFGHYHDNKMIDRRFLLLYEQIIPLKES